MENKDNGTAEVTETGEKVYEITEFVDDALASGKWDNRLKNEYIYSFKQGGREVSDLTASAYFHIALEHGISIVSHEFEKRKEGVLAYAEAEKLSTGQKHPGVAFESYFDAKDNFDKFCFQKALTKACRNAIKALIPADMKLAAVNQLSQLTPATAQALENNRQQQPALPPVEDDPKARAMRHGFAVWNDYKAVLSDLEITDELFWEGVREHYGVESRKDMTEANWKNLVASLELVNSEGEPFADWILNISPDAGVEDDDELPI